MDAAVAATKTAARSLTTAAIFVRTKMPMQQNEREREIDERNNLINEESSHVSSGSLASNPILINGNWAANYVRAHCTLNKVNFVCILKLIFIRLSIRVAFRETSYIFVSSWRNNGQVKRRRMKSERERKMAKSDTFLLDTIYVVDPFLRCFVMSLAFRSNKTKQARPESESPSFFIYSFAQTHKIYSHDQMVSCYCCCCCCKHRRKMARQTFRFSISLCISISTKNDNQFTSSTAMGHFALHRSTPSLSCVQANNSNSNKQIASNTFGRFSSDLFWRCVRGDPLIMDE